MSEKLDQGARSAKTEQVLPTYSWQPRSRSGSSADALFAAVSTYAAPAATSPLSFLSAPPSMDFELGTAPGAPRGPWHAVGELVVRCRRYVLRSRLASRHRLGPAARFGGSRRRSEEAVG